MNTARPRGDDVPAELRRTAERANLYDIELYRYAQELFDGIEERGEFEFGLELAALRAAKVKGEIQHPETAPPPTYGGDEEEWRMLVHAKATSMRRERELVETWAVAYELAQGDPGVLVKLGRIKETQAAGAAADQASRKGTRKALRAMRRTLDDETPPQGRGQKARKRRARRDG